jgi:hypothetical protein
LVQLYQALVFFLAPRFLLDRWVQLIVPSLTALFAGASLQFSCNHRPLGAVVIYQISDNLVFLCGPWTFRCGDLGFLGFFKGQTIALDRRATTFIVVFGS